MTISRFQKELKILITAIKNKYKIEIKLRDNIKHISNLKFRLKSNAPLDLTRKSFSNPREKVSDIFQPSELRCRTFSNPQILSVWQIPFDQLTTLNVGQCTVPRGNGRWSKDIPTCPFSFSEFQDEGHCSSSLGNYYKYLCMYIYYKII